MIPVESILELITVNGDKVYLFPDRRASSVLTAESKLVNSVRHTGDAFLTVHVGKDRNTEVRHINSTYVVEYKTDSSKVPSDIIALYVAPEDETEEDKLARINTIKAYFEK